MLLGAAMLAGRSISLRLPSIPGRATGRLPAAARMIVFGVGYAAASLSCTFGVLLAVIAQAQATASLAGLFLVFGGYATVLLVVTMATAAAGSAVTRRIAPLARYGPKLTAAVLVLTGTYLAWYWYPAVAGDATAAGRTGGIAAVSAAASDWIQGHTGLVGGLFVATVLAVLLLAIIRKRPQTPPATTQDCCDSEPSPSADDQPDTPSPSRSDPARRPSPH